MIYIVLFLGYAVHDAYSFTTFMVLSFFTLILTD